MESHSDSGLKSLRFFGLKFLLGMGLVAATGWFFLHWTWPILLIPGVLGVFHGVFALVNPRVLKPTSWFFHKLIDLLTLVFSVIFLTIIYYLLFTPVAFFLRLAGKDQLKNSGGWRDPAPSTNDPQHLHKQF